MDSIDLKDRTKQFALRAIKLVDALPKTTAGRAIGAQLIRSATSVAANYRATCKARSRAEFVAKIGVVEEESDESAFWLELLIESELLKRSLLEQMWTEANQLNAIMAASRITANHKRNAPNRQSPIGNRQ
ncbi:four helix bundle protein [soil metagenome]